MSKISSSKLKIRDEQANRFKQFHIFTFRKWKILNIFVAFSFLLKPKKIKQSDFILSHSPRREIHPLYFFSYTVDPGVGYI